MTTYSAPKKYIREFNLLRKENYLFSGFNYNIHFWKITGFPLGSNKKCSMGYELETNDIVFTWDVSPYVFCMIKMDKLNEFFNAAQEAMEKDAPTAITRCRDLTFVNTKNQSIHCIGSPSIEVKGRRIRACDDKENVGFTDKVEIQKLVDWFDKPKIQTEITSAAL